MRSYVDDRSQQSTEICSVVHELFDEIPLRITCIINEHGMWELNVIMSTHDGMWELNVSMSTHDGMWELNVVHSEVVKEQNKI
jgi:hypothetical protein